MTYNSSTKGIVNIADLSIYHLFNAISKEAGGKDAGFPPMRFPTQADALDGLRNLVNSVTENVDNQVLSNLLAEARNRIAVNA